MHGLGRCLVLPLVAVALVAPPALAAPDPRIGLVRQFLGSLRDQVKGLPPIGAKSQGDLAAKFGAGFKAGLASGLNAGHRHPAKARAHGHPAPDDDLKLAWEGNGRVLHATSKAMAGTLRLAGDGPGQHTAALDIGRLPDGTTGRVELGASAPTWAPMEIPLGDPPTSGTFDIPDVDGLDAVNVRLDLTPQGSSSLHVVLDAGADHFAPTDVSGVVGATASWRVPSHLYAKGNTLGVTFDQQLQARVLPGQTGKGTVAWTGAFTLADPHREWQNRTQFDLPAQHPEAWQATFDWTDLTDRLHVVGTAFPVQHEGVRIDARVLATDRTDELAHVVYDDQTELADVTYGDGTHEQLDLRRSNAKPAATSSR